MEHQIKHHQPVLVRDNDQDIWIANFFSHYDEGKIPFPFVCVCGSYKQCIPAAGNEYLIGTTNNPTQPEPGFQTGDRVEVRDDDTEEWIRATYLSENPELYFPYLVFFKNRKNTEPFKYCRHVKTDNSNQPEPEFKFGDKVEIRNRDEENWTPAIYVDKYPLFEKKWKYEVILQKSKRTTCWLQCRHAEGDK